MGSRAGLSGWEERDLGGGAGKKEKALLGRERKEREREDANEKERRES